MKFEYHFLIPHMITPGDIAGVGLPTCMQGGYTDEKGVPVNTLQVTFID